MNRIVEQKLHRCKASIRLSRVSHYLAMFAMTLAIVSGGAAVAHGQQIVDSTTTRPVDVKAVVSKSVVQVAEPFGLDVTVTVPAGTKVFFPTVNSQLGDFDVDEHQDMFDVPSATGSGGQRSWTRHYSLESIVTGDLEIPPIEIPFTRGQTTGSVTTKALPMRVVSVLEDRADPTKFRDIKSVVDVDVPTPSSNGWIFWTLGGMGAGVLSLAAIALVARRKKYLTPSQWAVGELEALKSSPALQADNAEPVLREMSNILRGYFEMQFEISAPAQTTEEFFQFVEQKQFVDLKLLEQIAELLSMADQAKFAGLQLTQTELHEVIDSAIGLIDSFTPETMGAKDDESQASPSQPSNNPETPQ